MTAMLMLACLCICQTMVHYSKLAAESEAHQPRSFGRCIVHGASMTSGTTCLVYLRAAPIEQVPQACQMLTICRGRAFLDSVLQVLDSVWLPLLLPMNA